MAPSASAASWPVPAPTRSAGPQSEPSVLGPIEAVLVLLPFVLPLAAAIYLGFRLRAQVATVAGDPPS